MKTVIYAVLASILFLGFDCDKNQTPPTSYKFQVGQIVTSKVSGERGIILWRSYSAFSNKNAYQVKFASLGQTTQTHVLDPDGAVMVQHIQESCWEFELDSLKQEGPKR